MERARDGKWKPPLDKLTEAEREEACAWAEAFEAKPPRLQFAIGSLIAVPALQAIGRSFPEILQAKLRKTEKGWQLGDNVLADGDWVQLEREPTAFVGRFVDSPERPRLEVALNGVSVLLDMVPGERARRLAVAEPREEVAS